MAGTTDPSKPQSPLLSFAETRLAHLWQFQRTTPEQRVQWLADMLEIMTLARQARERNPAAPGLNQPST